MSFENKEQSINPETLSQLKEAQAKRDLDSVTKIFLSLTPKDRNEFVNEYAKKDPVYAQIISEITPYFSWEWNKLYQEAQTSTETQETTSQQSTPLLWETWATYLDKNKDFKPFLDTFDEKEINWKKEVVLTPEVFSALSRYDSNKEPLAKLLWQKEINKAQSELDEKLRYMRTAMIHSPENLDKSQSEARQEFKKQEQEIIQKYLTQAETFVNLIKNTSIWKEIIENTAKLNIQTNLRDNINKNISNESWKETPLWNNIETQTKELLWRLAKIQWELNKEISDFKRDQTYLQTTDPWNYTEMLANTIPNKYDKEIKQELRNYALSVWKELISNNTQIIQDKKEFNLPLWDWTDVVLDFAELWDIEWKSQEEIQKLFEKNFDDIYKDSLTEKLFREITSKKWIIDIVWIVGSWLLTVKYSVDTAWLWIPTSALIFTASENTYRAIAYELFNIEWWAMAWLWISESDTTQDIVRKKLFELASNWVLFWIFKWTWFTQTAIESMIKDKAFMEELSYKIASYWIKTWVEAWFFTYYTIASNNLQQKLQENPNAKEIIDTFTNVWSMQDFIKLYTYNIWFVVAVKTWWSIAEKQIIWNYEKLIEKEIQILNWKWINLVNWVFYRANNKMQELPIEDFGRLVELNKKLAKFSTESYRKPESWRAWKTINTDYPDASKKFENLEKYSKETREWWVTQALWDKTIWQTLEAEWLKWWKWVWEWLLRKSWFNNDEVDAFKKWELKWEKPLEVRALGEMDRAMEVVYREYRDGFLKLNSWLSLKEAFPQLSSDLYSRLKIMINKDNDLGKNPLNEEKKRI